MRRHLTGRICTEVGDLRDDGVESEAADVLYASQHVRERPTDVRRMSVQKGEG